MNKKGLILIIMRQEVSHINVTLKLARELSKKGYRIIYIGDSRMEKYVLAQGFEYKLIEPDKDFLRNIKNQYEKELHKAGKLKKLRLGIRLQNQMEKRVNDHLLNILEKWLAANTPDLVILGQGGSILFYSLSFLKNGIPIVGLDTNLASRFCLKSPPAFSKIIPNPKIKGINYIRNLAAWSKIYLQLSSQKVYHLFKLLYGFGILSYNKAYSISKEIKKNGGKLQWWEYNTIRLKVPAIILCPIEFDFPSVTETKYRCYGGSGVDVKRMQIPFSWSDVDDSKQLIYCSIGSHPDYCQERIRLFRSVIDALKKRPHLQIIIQISDKAERDSLNPLPDNVIIAEWVAQIEVLSKSHIFITHGGLASVRESIYCGVPMIVFPWGVEQPGNSARIMFHHLGLRGNLKKVTSKITGQLVDKMCNDPSFHHAVKKMQKAFREHEDCKKAVDYIENMIFKTKKTGTDGQSKQPEQRVVIEI